MGFRAYECEESFCEETSDMEEWAESLNKPSQLPP